jgi:hypothetical protein
MRKLLVAVVLAFAALVGPAGADTAPAQGGGPNNIVISQTTTDQAWQVRSQLEIAPAAGPTVASTNIADAETAGCTGCRASAVAVQVVFVTGNPSVYTPGNAAVAATGGCNSCGAYAYAWQYLLQTDGPVYLSPTGQLEVQELRREIADTAASVDPTSLAADQQLTSELDTLTARLKSVVDSEVQSAGVHATGTPTVDVRQAEPLDS